MLDIKITRTTAPKAKPDESNLGFGKKFTDHMFVMDYTEGEGWHDARIVPYGPFELDPATVVFHYAQEIFEGMKAYRTADDTVQLFRPDCNAKRFQDSADRLCIPKILWRTTFRPLKRWWTWTVTGCPIPTVLPCISVLRVCKRRGSGRARFQALHFLHHLRSLGRLLCRGHQPRPHLRGRRVHPCRSRPDRLHQVRRNYAASIKAGELAEEQGYAQVLWLDGVEKKYVEEVAA